MKLRFGKIRLLIRTMKKERSVAVESMQKLAREIEFLDSGIAALSGKAGQGRPQTQEDVGGGPSKDRQGATGKVGQSARKKGSQAQHS